MGLRSRLEKQPTDFRQSTSYFGDRTLARKNHAKGSCSLRVETRLESRAIAFLPDSLERGAVGAGHRYSKAFRSALVRVDAERFIRDSERSPRAGKMADDSGHVSVAPMGAINCADHAPVGVTPSIS